MEYYLIVSPRAKKYWTSSQHFLQTAGQHFLPFHHPLPHPFFIVKNPMPSFSSQLPWRDFPNHNVPTTDVYVGQPRMVVFFLSCTWWMVSMCSHGQCLSSAQLRKCAPSMVTWRRDVPLMDARSRPSIKAGKRGMVELFFVLIMAACIPFSHKTCAFTIGRLMV